MRGTPRVMVLFIVKRHGRAFALRYDYTHDETAP